MRTFHRCVMAGVLAMVSFAVASQETSRSDQFGQSPAAASDMPLPATPSRRVRITNDNPAEAVIGERKASPPRRDDVPRNEPGDSPDARLPGTPGRQTPEQPGTEFQRFIADSTGKLLPVFGADFFAAAPSTFAPIANTPVPSDQVLGAGDELMIRGWGSIDIDYRAVIDRNGLISIPTVGSIVLAGVKAGDAEGVIRGAIARLYKGVTVNVNFGQLRAMTVYVVGQANRPGTYTISSMSTLVTAVFASGGPNPNGSMRRVQVKRGGVVAAELDLYAFIAKGDKAADIRLRDGDTIFIPQASGHVALVGKVNTPAIYELRGGQYATQDTIESLLDFAGGLPVVADPRRAFLERIDPSHQQPRSVEQFVLDGQGLKRALKDGDLLNVTAITPDFSNAVVLRGNVDQPVRVPFTPGMRIGELIPNREYLITRSSINRQNSAANDVDSARTDGQKAESIAARIGGLIDEINWDYAVVERINRADLTVSLIPFNLGKVFSEPAGRDNIVLQPGDTVTVFSQQDVAVPMEKRRVFVRVEGEVNVPGVYQMGAGDTVQSLLARAGGPTADAYLFGTAFYREKVRLEQQANLDKAATRLENQMRSEQSRSIANARAMSGVDLQAAESARLAEMQLAKVAIERFRQLKPTGRIAFGLDPADRNFARLPQLKLENGDRLVLPSRPDFIHVFGAVNGEASPIWRRNARVADYLKAVGVSADADTANIFVLRSDGSVLSRESGGWFFASISAMEIMPGDTIVVPEKFDKETAWTKFTKGTREWAQIFANFGLGAAAIKVLK